MPCTSYSSHLAIIIKCFSFVKLFLLTICSMVKGVHITSSCQRPVRPFRTQVSGQARIFKSSKLQVSVERGRVRMGESTRKYTGSHGFFFPFFMSLCAGRSFHIGLSDKTIPEREKGRDRRKDRVRLEKCTARSQMVNGERKGKKMIFIFFFTHTFFSFSHHLGLQKAQASITCPTLFFFSMRKENLISSTPSLYLYVCVSVFLACPKITKGTLTAS